jgi:RimJ/RimL family protein N-acetyltransferase
MKSTSIILRQWEDEDLEPFAAMNADEEVMRFFPKLLTKEESKESFMRARACIDEQGWGFWAVEVDGVFAGFTGLAEPKFTAHFTPCVEIGWRFRREYWGRSIAYSAALAAESFAFEKLNLPDLVSFTAAINTRSQRLMERLGFSRNEKEDFQHPSLSEDSPLRLHVLYRKMQNQSLHTNGSPRGLFKSAVIIPPTQPRMLLPQPPRLRLTPLCGHLPLSESRG